MYTLNKTKTVSLPSMTIQEIIEYFHSIKKTNNKELKKEFSRFIMSMSNDEFFNLTKGVDS